MARARPNPHRPAPAALAALALALALSPGARAQRVVLDKVVAVVDRDVVLQSELVDRMREIRAAAGRSGRPLPEESELRGDVLEALILESIQLQFAERASIRYDDDTINRVMAGMAAEAGLDFEGYVSELERQGAYLRTRERVRRQLTIQELQRGLVNQRIHVTEQEIDNFLNSEMGREAVAADYLIDHILVPAAAGDPPGLRRERREFAAGLAARIRDGEPIAAARAAALRSREHPIDGTNFSWRKADQLPRLFGGIVEDMAVGDVAGPIEAGNGYHIIQLRDRRGGTEQIVSQTRLRHIMLAPNEIRTEEQARGAVAELRRRIVEDGEDFASLARQNSDDAGSVVAGGDLDWVSEGGMPIEMETVVDAMAVGGISEPFRSATGWHIVEVLGRRETDLSREYTRSQAHNTLRARRFDLELQNWLIEIREEAFVELVD